MTEAEIMRAVQVRASQLGARLFRNNVGMGWTGQAHQPTRSEVLTVGLGDVVIFGARRIRFGLGEGSGDLTGWTPVEVGGRKLAVFTSVEVKSETGRLTNAQRAWMDVVEVSGGIAGVVRGPEALEGLLGRVP